MFYIDTHKSCSYQELIVRLNNTDRVITNYYKFDQLDFFVNLLAGIVSGVDMVLLDSDFSEQEVESLHGSPYEETSIFIPRLSLTGNRDLVERVMKSPTKIKLFTSGTTGLPKAVEHSIFSLTRNVKQEERFRGAIWGFAYNPTHMAGIQVFFQALINCNTLVNIFELSKEHVYQSIEMFEITHISATPTFYRLLVPSLKPYPIVKHITFGGEKSDIILHQKVSEVFPEAKIRNVYALTEAGALFASKNDGFLIPDNIKEKIRFVEGELFIHKSLLGSSPSLDDGNPWYGTGDMVEFIDEGQQYFRILARNSEMINIGGYKVNPNEVEGVLRNMDGVRESKVYGVPNSVLGNILCADVVITETSIKESDIRRFLSDYLQNYKVPRKIFFKSTISLSRTGKMERRNVER